MSHSGSSSEGPSTAALEPSTPLQEVERTGPAKRRRRRVAVVVGIATVVGLAVAGVAWWSHPNALMPYASGASISVPLGDALTSDTGLQTVTRGDASPNEAVITIDQVTPVVIENSSNARISVSLCLRKVGTQGVGTVIGSHQSLAGSCTAVVPVQGATTPLGFISAQVILRIVPQQAGVVHIAGFRVRYREGIRRGSQIGGMEIVVTTP